MLVANNQHGERCLAWEVDKIRKPFYCPECQKEVILKKGTVREHHFAHIPPFNCQYGSGESQLHFKAKREIYNSLKDHPNCSKCELERNLKVVRPDISLYIGGTRVIIELQRSTIDIDIIIKRTHQYTKMGCYILWILPIQQPKELKHSIRKLDDDAWSLIEEEKIVCKPKQWELFLHTLYFGRVCYWQEGALVTPYHFSKIEQYIPMSKSEWHDEEGGYHIERWGDYSKLLKAVKSFVPGKILHIAEGFKPIQRRAWDSKDHPIPACKLWCDTLKKWW